MFLSGDYAFLSLMYGLSGASGKNYRTHFLSGSFNLYIILGKKPCILCLITLDQLQILPAARGPCAPRTLDSMLLDHQHFMEEGEGNL